MSKARAALKRLIVGRPMSSGELEHTLLPKTIALPVFSSDPLSSNAYATQEAMIVLAMAGTMAFSLIVPISLAVALLLAIVVTSYRQTVRAYPQGGGAYRVSRENIGLYPGLTAGSALLIDYCLTVAVSITAGADAIVSAVPALEDDKIPIALGFVALVTVANLRGAKEAGVAFAIPTYGFVLSIYLMVGTGIAKCLGGGCPPAETAGLGLEDTHALTFFLILKAFAAGTTALTGVEAIADGVPAFRYPQSKNAASTLGIMAGLSISMFLGISWLARNTGVVYVEHETRTVLAQVADAVFGGGPLFFFVQIMSAAILVLAANTAYQDFPRLSSILAGDRLLPGQMMNRGDRLVFSNGVIILAAAASGLILLFDATLTRLIQLYLVGAFTSFTLSQTGMVIRSIKLKPPHWQRTVAVSGFGATVTGVVLSVIIVTKFAGGAWLIIVAIPSLIFVMRSILRHYDSVSAQLEHPSRRPSDRRPGHQHVVLYIPKVDAAAAKAVGYVRSVRAADVVAVTPDPACGAAWRRLAPDIDIVALTGSGSVRRKLRSYLQERRSTLGSDDFLTVVIPEVLKSTGLLELIRRPASHRLKLALLPEEGIQVLDVPLLRQDIDPAADLAHEPARNHCIVLTRGVHNATLQAIEYAETLRPTDLRAVSFALEMDTTEKLARGWLSERIPIPLEIQDSPFRDIGRSLIGYVSKLRPDGYHRVVTVVIPEFVVGKKRHQLLHGQTALLVKRHLLFQPGVVVVSVPYHLDE